MANPQSRTEHDNVKPVGKAQPIMLTMAGLLFCNFLIAVDTTCLAVALPEIAIDLSATDTQTYWAGTAFVLCSSVFQPIFSSLSDAVGRKPIWLFALVLFTIGSVLCAVAKDISTLIGGRCVQGTGAAGLVVLTYVILADLFDLKRRAKFLSLIGLTWLTGAVCGPIMSGGFTDSSATWRWVFYFNLPFCGIGLVVSTLYLKVPYQVTGSRLQKLREFDWIGSVMFAASLTSFLIALSWGGIMYNWSSWRTVVPMIIGIAGLVAWALYSDFVSKKPMIPLRILNNRTAAISYLTMFVHGFCQFGFTYYMPIYYEAVLGYSPLAAGLAALPVCLASNIGTVTTGILINKTHRIKIFCLAGWSMLLLGMGLTQVFDINTSVPAWIFLSVPGGIGFGILFSAVPLATQTAAEQTGSSASIAEIKSMAASLNPFFRAVGQSIGIVVGQAALSNGMKARLGEKAAKEAVGLALEVKYLSSAEQVVVKAAFVDSLRTNWWVLFGLTALAAALTFFTNNQSISVVKTADVEAVEEKDDNGSVKVDSPVMEYAKGNNVEVRSCESSVYAE